MKKIISIIILVVTLLLLLVPANAFYREDMGIRYKFHGPLLSAEEKETKLRQIADYWYEKYCEMDYEKDILVMNLNVNGYDSGKMIMRDYCENGYNLFNIASSPANENGYYIDERLALHCEHMKAALEEATYTKEDFYKIIKYNDLDNALIYKEIDADGYPDHTSIYDSDYAFDYESPDLKFYGYYVRDGLWCLAVTDGKYRLFMPFDGYHYWDNAYFTKKLELVEEDSLVGMLVACSELDIRGTPIDYRTDPIQDWELNVSKLAPSTGGSEVVSVAVLCAGASLLGAVAGAVLGKKRRKQK